MNSGKDRSRTIAAIIGFAVLAALGPLVFSVAGNLLGIIYIVAVIAFFFVIVNRWDRGGDVEVATTTDSRRRILVLAHADADRNALVRALRARNAGTSEARIVVPALATRVERFTGEVDEAAANADNGAESLVQAAAGVVGDARGEVGDSDPRTALEDALRTFPADEVVVLPPPERAREFFSVSGPEETIRGVRLPITVIDEDAS